MRCQVRRHTREITWSDHLIGAEWRGTEVRLLPSGATSLLHMLSALVEYRLVQEQKDKEMRRLCSSATDTAW